jgi:hypothetical protein
MTTSGPWTVFLSHTSELFEYPAGWSYIAAVQDAVAANGHKLVDMHFLQERDQPPAEMFIEKVHECDLYLGVLGTRYGPPVRDRADVSYPELEFDAAGEVDGMDRLMFLLDTEARDVGIPRRVLKERNYADRQSKFRKRVRSSGATIRVFESPEDLRVQVDEELRELAHTRSQVASGPAEPQQAPETKLVTPPRTTATALPASTRTVPAHIFVSYSRHDQKYVNQLVSHLRMYGLVCWIDRSGIDYGSRWKTVVRDAVDSCGACVVVMTPEAEESQWVDREISRAEEGRKPILPLLLRGTKFFGLGHLHYEDVAGGTMPSKEWIEQLRRSADLTNELRSDSGTSIADHDTSRATSRRDRAAQNDAH